MRIFKKSTALATLAGSLRDHPSTMGAKNQVIKMPKMANTREINMPWVKSLPISETLFSPALLEIKACKPLFNPWPTTAKMR